MKSNYRRVRMDQAFIRKNPTMTDGIKMADGDLPANQPPVGSLPKLRPMKIERLRAMGGPYTEQDRARLLYDEHKSAAKVAQLMGKSEYWVRQACAWDIANKSA